MSKELLHIIKQYQDAVADMFPKLATHLGITLPVTNDEWIIECHKKAGGKASGETTEGIKFFIHGYGVNMYDGKKQVDFDLDSQGQIDGIDIWKLAEFVERNKVETSLSDGNDIEKEILKAVDGGDMKYSGNLLYYLI